MSDAAAASHNGNILAYRRLPAKVELSRLVQVEMVKPATDLTLGGQVLAEITRGASRLRIVLWSLSGLLLLAAAARFVNWQWVA